MQPFDPWTWRDPSALAGGCDQTTPADVPRMVKKSPAFDPDDFARPEYREQIGGYYEESYRRG